MEAVDANWARRALPGFFSPLEVVASVPTTMSRAADLAAAGEPEGATVVAEEQTEGRGRLGRAWVAPPGTSLLVSVVLRPPMARESVWLTVAAAGVALAGAVDEVAPGAAPAGLKWPNDLELHGAKAAGLLAEAQAAGLSAAATGRLLGQLLDAPGRPLPAPAVLQAGPDGHPRLVRRRVTCCLNYTVAGQPCATCPLLPPSETRRRLLAPA